MLFRNISIETLVCLSCGESFNLNEIAVERVGDLKVPAKIKAAGKMFRMFACPQCQSSHLGFVPAKIDVQIDIQPNVEITGISVGTEVPSIEIEDIEDMFVEPPEDNWSGGLQVDGAGAGVVGLTVNEPKPPKKVSKINNAINEDDFANMRKPKRRRGPPVTQKVKCTSCGKMKDVGAGFGGDFGTKCDDCLKGALKNKKGSNG